MPGDQPRQDDVEDRVADQVVDEKRGYELPPVNTDESFETLGLEVRLHFLEKRDHSPRPSGRLSRLSRIGLSCVHVDFIASTPRFV